MPIYGFRISQRCDKPLTPSSKQMIYLSTATASAAVVSLGSRFAEQEPAETLDESEHTCVTITLDFIY